MYLQTSKSLAYSMSLIYYLKFKSLNWKEQKNK
jgi:hypothetical protein